MNTKGAAGWLGLFALVAVIIAPPEAFGSGRAFLIVAATAAFLISAIDGTVSKGYLLGGLVGGGLLLGHSLLLSLDPYRSLEFLTLAWAYYCLFGFFRYSRQDFRNRIALTLIVLAGAVSAYGIHQFFWGLEQAYGYIMYSGATEAMRIPVADRVSSGRIFSTFALPGTLWGFLILTLPLHGLLWKAGHSIRNGALLFNGGLILSAAALTRSYGFILGLVVVLASCFYTRSKGLEAPTLRWKPALLVMLVAMPLVPVLYVVRGVDYNPITLRLQNWLTAWEIFAAHPWGAGLNAYGVLYLQHQQPGANETQFAHNTPLQFLAELGILGIAAATLAVIWIMAQRSRFDIRDPHSRYLLLAVLVWIVHNLMDINVYFGSIGAVGVTLVALMAWSPNPAPPESDSPLRRRLVQSTGIVAVLVILASGLIYVSGELLYRARTELGTADVSRAAETLAIAARVNPFDSAIYHEAGQISLELYHTEDDPTQLDLARMHFQRAIELSPLKVGPHIGLGLCFSSVDEAEKALRELEIAQSLHPANTQVSAIRRLIEQRQRNLVNSTGSP